MPWKESGFVGLPPFGPVTARPPLAPSVEVLRTLFYGPDSGAPWQNNRRTVAGHTSCRRVVDRWRQ